MTDEEILAYLVDLMMVNYANLESTGYDSFDIEDEYDDFYY